jgi:group I intron endonuclease
MENCGVYAIVNTINNHRYIGSSCDIIKRWQRHQEQLRNGNHHSRYLQRAWNLWGGENFEFLFLLQCDRKVRLEREQEYMATHHPEYNMAVQAMGGSYPGVHTGIKRPDMILRNKLHPTRGHTGCLHSDETKAKMSAAWVKRKERGLAENWNNGEGKILSKETRAKIKAAQVGKTMSPETRAKISAALMGHPNYCPSRDKKTGCFVGVIS